MIRELEISAVFPESIRRSPLGACEARGSFRPALFGCQEQGAATMHFRGPEGGGLLQVCFQGLVLKCFEGCVNNGFVSA